MKITTRAGPHGISRSIQVNAMPGRPRINLGPVSAETAEQCRAIITHLLRAVRPEPWATAWLGACSPALLGRLAALGLQAHTPPPTLGGWCEEFCRRPGIKASTTTKYRQTAQRLVAHFGATARLDTIRPDWAHQWADVLARSGLATASARGHVRNAKAIFQQAAARELIPRNPFRGLNSSSPAAERPAGIRVSPADTARLLAALPGPQWRALVGLARYAGLRVPSETATLTWTMMDWTRGRLLVASPKTEAHAGQSQREVPIDPRLMPLLLEAHEAAGDDARMIRLSPHNVRRALQQAIQRAGLAPWRHVFQQLRRDCENEWKLRFPAWAVHRWIGHSAAVSDKYYESVPDDLFHAASNIREQRESSITSAQSH